MWQYPPKLNRILTCDLTTAPSYIPKRNECIWQPKDMNRDVHSRFIYNSPELVTTQMPSKSRMDKQIVLYLHKAVLHSIEKELTTAIYNETESHRHSHEQKKTDTDMYTLHGGYI